MPRRAPQGPVGFQCVQVPVCVACLCVWYWVRAASLPVPCSIYPSGHGLQPCSRVRKLKGGDLQPLPSPLPSQPSPLGLTMVPGRRTWNRTAVLCPCPHWGWSLAKSPLSQIGSPPAGASPPLWALEEGPVSKIHKWPFYCETLMTAELTAVKIHILCLFFSLTVLSQTHC